MPRPVSELKLKLFSSAGRTQPKKAAMVSIDNFEVLRVLGKGCAGKVLLARQRESCSLFAIKAIPKTHVLAHRELAHTRTEQAVLRRMALERSNPFVVGLHFSFHDAHTLYLVLDFHPGGDLATQLARWGRLGRDRAKFYAAEIASGLGSLHAAGIIYRDLKPENLLISAQGHIVMTDFGLSRDFKQDHLLDLALPRPHWLGPGARSVSAPPEDAWFGPRELTTTFCGTAEYLAPEVLLGEAYSYECDSWSLGTMLFEMLAGKTPFWNDNTAEMYRSVINERLSFKDCDPNIFDHDTQDLIRSMLNKNPLLRATDNGIQRHAYFKLLDWKYVTSKRYVPPFIPELNPSDPTDLSQFDDLYLAMKPQVGDADGEEAIVEPPECEPQDAFDQYGVDVFDGYSYDPRMDGETSDMDNDSVDERSKMDLTPTGPEELDVNEEGDLSTAADATFSSTGTHSTQATTAANGSPKLDELTHSPSLLPVMENGLPMLENGHMRDDSTPALTIESESSEDDDWEHMEAEGVARNGAKGTTLFARGVKDRYKLLLASSTSPNTNGNGTSSALNRSESSNGSSSPRLLSRLNLSGTLRRSSLNPSASRKSLTPEPPRSSMLIRLGSHRSDASGTEHRSKKAHRSATSTTAASDLESNASAGTNMGSIRKRTIRRLTLGAFGKS